MLVRSTHHQAPPGLPYTGTIEWERDNWKSLYLECERRIWKVKWIMIYSVALNVLSWGLIAFAIVLNFC